MPALLSADGEDSPWVALLAFRRPLLPGDSVITSVCQRLLAIDALCPLVVWALARAKVSEP